MLTFKSKINILDFCKIETIANGFSGNVDGISFDSRNIPPNSIFFAMEGQNVDGHQFVPDALNKGANVAIVSKILPEYKNFSHNKTIIKVDSPINFMSVLAKEYRKYIKCDVIGITGTIGKTTTKYLIADVLRKRFKVLFAPDSYNNVLGLSYTLLNYNNEEKIVLELGVNHVGEMDKLVEIAKPDIAVITYISPVHLEGMKSVFNIFEEKKKITKYAKRVLINSDSFLLSVIASGCATISSCSSVSVEKIGMLDAIDYSGLIVQKGLNGIKFTVKGKYGNEFFEIPSHSQATVYSALFSYVLAKSYGISYEDIYDAFRNFNLPKLRNQIIQKGERTIIADCYNASPLSMYMAISSFCSSLHTQRLALILGDMLELGDYGPFYHKQVANFLMSFSGLKILVGKEFKAGSDFLNKYNVNHYYFENTGELADFVPKIVTPEYKYILLKASRKLQLEKLVNYL